MTNRLAGSLSPYLRQHAENPVDWYAWGEEAFEAAGRRDVPVFVSIGYSTCHWCHVMARESFSDPETAAYLNAHFVSVKVDREEHPGVDASYLAAASAFTQGLGWPLSVFVTPAGRAFYAGTYFPPLPLPGRPAFREVLEAVVDAWENRRDQVEHDSARLVEALAEAEGAPSAEGAPPGPAELDAVAALLARHEDAEHGGFGTEPKFPTTPVLAFLLERGEPDGVALALRALKGMAGSALRDPVEGGFFRYATRADWSAPHYERMLFDNAQLLEAYAEAWRRTGSAPAREAAEGIAGFLLSVLHTPEGLFASGQDSESTIAGERSEGGYYARDAAARVGLDPPAVDEKALSGWNGLAIGALARAGAVLEHPEWVRAAAGAADALLRTHLGADGVLARLSVSGRVSPARAGLEDYGMLAQGLLELAVAAGEPERAVAARRLVDAVLAAGEASGTLFAVPGGGDPVLAGRGLGFGAGEAEGSAPSGAAALAGAALGLHALGAGREYRLVASRALAAEREATLQNPIAHGALLRACARLAAPLTQLVVVMPDGDAADARADARLAATARASGAGVVAVVGEGRAREFTRLGFDLFAERTARDGRAAAYLCREFACRLPTLEAEELAEELAEDGTTTA